MSEFASTDFNSRHYSLHRPSYTIDFFKYIFKYANLTPNWKYNSLSIVDIGSGPGTCFTTIIPYLLELITTGELNVAIVNLWVTDISETMLEEAKININNLLEEVDDNNNKIIQIKYLQAGSEDIAKYIESESIDIVFAAECAHWLNKDKWFQAMNSILKKGTGVFSYWGYVDPVFIKINDSKSLALKANEFYEEFVYESPDRLGPYWEQPGRNILRNLFHNINDSILNDRENWRDVIVCYRNSKSGIVESFGSCKGFKIDEEALTINKTINVMEFISYVDTWSASSKWNKTHDCKVSLLFYEELESIIHWKLLDSVEIEFQTVYTLSKKK
jgi:ubiquinone/menaquinone biosynthesis C-methylase UbiE